MMRVKKIAAIALIAAAAGALAGLAAPPGASAAEKPKLEKIEPQRAFPGGPVEITGTGFGDPAARAAVSAKVGDEAAVVSDHEPTRIQILVPFDLKKGKYSVVVTVAGADSNKLSLEIRDEKERLEKGAEDAQTELSSGGVQRAKVITLDPPEAVTGGGSTVVRVSGSADLPDGCVVQLNFTIGPDSLDRTTATVAGQRIQANFGPYPKLLYPGIYYIEAYFNIHQQAKPIKVLFKEQFKDPKAAKERELGTDRAPLQVGGASELEAQGRELRSHAKAAIGKIRQLQRDLEAAYGSAGRSAYGKGGSVDEGAWEAWLDKRALANVTGDDRAKRVSEMKARKDFLTANGAFADAKWRDWLDLKWREELSSQLKAHTAYREKYLHMRDHDVMDKLTVAFEQLLKLSSYRSRELYEAAAIPASPNDASAGAVSGAQIEADMQVLERGLAAAAEQAGGK